MSVGHSARSLYSYFCDVVFDLAPYPRSVQWNGVMTLAPITALEDSLPASLASLSGLTGERGIMYSSRE